MEITANELKNNIFIKYDGQIWQVLKSEHNYRGRGAAFIGARLRNLKTSRVLEASMRSNEKLELLSVDAIRCQYLYAGEESVFVMDSQTFEQYELPVAVIGHMAEFFKEGDEVMVLMHEGTALTIRPPQTVRLKVTQTDAAVKGDTATKATKPATLETGYTLQVPLFIKEGDILLLNPETGEYIERSSQG